MISSALAGCVPYALPPLKAELGGATLTGQKPALHAGGGAHLASGVLDKQQAFDVGVGGFIEVDEDSGNTAAAYVDTAVFVERDHQTRTSLGVRGEVRWTADAEGVQRRGYGAKLRVEREMFGTTNKGYSESARCGAFAGAARGTGGIGVFAEAGPVWMPEQRTAFSATAGITLRVPSTIGIIVAIPGCR